MKAPSYKISIVISGLAVLIFAFNLAFVRDGVITAPGRGNQTTADHTAAMHVPEASDNEIVNTTVPKVVSEAEDNEAAGDALARRPAEADPPADPETEAAEAESIQAESAPAETGAADMDTLIEEGNQYYAQNDYQSALDSFIRATELGEGAALQDVYYTLGMMYQRGAGVPQDYEQAVEWYNKAVEHGHWGARLQLAAMIDLGLIDENKTNENAHNEPGASKPLSGVVDGIHVGKYINDNVLGRFEWILSLNADKTFHLEFFDFIDHHVIKGTWMAETVSISDNAPDSTWLTLTDSAGEIYQFRQVELGGTGSNPPYGLIVEAFPLGSDYIDTLLYLQG